MRNKLVFKLVEPTTENWEKYISLEHVIFSICASSGVHVFNHTCDSNNFVVIIDVEYNDTNEIVNCILQVAKCLDFDSLDFKLVKRSEIDADFNEVKSLPLFRVNKLIDQVDESVEKLRIIG